MQALAKPMRIPDGLNYLPWPAFVLRVADAQSAKANKTRYHWAIIALVSIYLIPRFKNVHSPTHASENTASLPLRELVPSLSLRLDDEEIQAIEVALSDLNLPVYLFGSRIDPKRRGGDIDLLVLADAPAFETSQRIATRFFSQCEEKIDVIVMNPNCLTPGQQAFLDTIQVVRIH